MFFGSQCRRVLPDHLQSWGVCHIDGTPRSGRFHDNPLYSGHHCRFLYSGDNLYVAKRKTAMTVIALLFQKWLTAHWFHRKQGKIKPKTRKVEKEISDQPYCKYTTVLSRLDSQLLLRNQTIRFIVFHEACTTQETENGSNIGLSW